MEKYLIKFSSLEDVQKFVSTAEKCNFKIDICYAHYMVDGKSIIGVVSLGLDHKIEVICYGHDRTLKEFLERYKAA